MGGEGRLQPLRALDRKLHRRPRSLGRWTALDPPPKGSDDEINARWQAEDAAFTLAESRQRAKRAFARRLAAIEAVPHARWENDLILEKIARADGHEHYTSHRRYIETGSPQTQS